MAKLEAALQLDPARNSGVLVVDMFGSDPFEHEFLKQLFKGELSTSMDEKDAKGNLLPGGRHLGPEDLRVRIPVSSPNAFENAKRAAEGRPSVEEEAEQKAAAQAAADADARSAADQAKADKKKADADEKAARDFDLEKARVTGQAIGEALAAAQKQG